MTKPLPMTPARRVALVIGTPIALLIIGWTALTAVAWAGQASYRVHLRIPVRSHALTLAVNSGQVSLRGGDTGIVRATGTAHYSLVRPRVTSQSTSSGTSIRSACEALTGPCSLDFAVTMPAGLTTNVSDGSGDLAVSGLHGRVTLQAGSGQVRVSSLSGDVRIRDDSGNVTGELVTSPELHISAGSGDIDVTGLSSQQVTVSSQSGNTTLTFARVPDRVQVSSDSGNVSLVLPPGSTAYRVQAHTSSGTTTVHHLPTDSRSPHVISVTDASGNISITTR